MHRIAPVLAILALLTLGACYKPKSEGKPLGSADNPLVMAFVPSTEAEKVLDSGDQLAAMLTERTGLHIKTLMASSYEGIVAAMGVGKVQVAWLPPMAYLFARQRNGDRAALEVVRHGKPTYCGQIIVLADSPMKSVADLKGKRVAFAEQASASGHLYPRTLMLENGVDPEKDLSGYTFAGSHDSALIALLKGSTDAACCFDDARTKLSESSFPDIMQKTRVLAYTPDIPADNVTLAALLSPELSTEVTNALLAIAGDAQGKKVLMDLYEVEGLVPAADSDYDPVRRMAELLHLNIEEEAKKLK